MNRIAVCDDELMSQNMLRGLIERLPFAVSCNCFSTGEDLLQACQNGHQFDIVFLDIKMNDSPLGIRIATEVKELLPNTVLIYVSGYPEYITKALYTKPDQFLLKPVTYDELLEVVLATMKEKYDSANERKLHFQCKHRKIALYPRQIYYMESMGHSIIVHAQSQNEFAISSTMEEQEKQLCQYSFVKIHRCYLINLRFVYQIEGNELIMENDIDKKFTISRRYRAEFTEKYKTFMYQNMKGEK